MTDLVPDNPKKRRLFIWTSSINLVFLILLALYLSLLMQLYSSPSPADGNAASAGLLQSIYTIAPPAFGVIGLLLAIAWKPLRRGVIVLLALHYILMLSVILLVGYADVTIMLSELHAGVSAVSTLLAILAVLLFLFFWNIKSLKDLDLPSIFGKR